MRNEPRANVTDFECFEFSDEECERIREYVVNQIPYDVLAYNQKVYAYD